MKRLSRSKAAALGYQWHERLARFKRKCGAQETMEMQAWFTVAEFVLVDAAEVGPRDR